VGHVAPGLAGDFSPEDRSPEQMRRAIEEILDKSPNIKRQKLAAKLGVLSDDRIFSEALETVRRTRDMP
jgi:hypothetical protein